MDDSAQLRVSARCEDGLAVIVLEGELDLTSAAQARQRMTEVLTENPARLVIDLSGLAFMDSQGLKLIAQACRGLPAGRDVVIRDPSPSVYRMLTLTGVDQVCTVEGQQLPPLPGAVAGLRDPAAEEGGNGTQVAWETGGDLGG